MSLRSQLREFSVNAVDDKTDPPDHVSASECGDDYEDVPPWSIEVSPVWKNSRDNPFDDEETPDVEMQLPDSYYKFIEEGDLYDTLSTVFDTLHDRVALDESATLGEFSFSERTGKGLTADADTEFRGMVLVTVEHDVTPAGEYLRQKACEDLHELDPDLTPGQCSEVTAVFDDWAECDLLSIRVTIDTPHPHRYYAEVDSLEAYLDVVADSPEEAEELAEKETYEVDTRVGERRVDAAGDDVPEPFTKLTEGLMRNRVRKRVEVEGDWCWEGERLTVVGDRGETAFWVLLPFDWP